MARLTEKNLADLAVSTGKIQDNAVTQDKFRPENDSYVKARNAGDSADIDIWKLDSSDRIVFASVPQVSSDPALANDLVRKSYVDAVLEGLKPKEAVRAASTADVDISTELENGDSIDGVVLATNDRVLLKDQTDATQNGIYIVAASGAASRATDFDSLTPVDEINGAYVPVQEGTDNQGKFFVQTGTVATIGSDDIDFVYFNSISSLVGGDGIDITATTISVDHDSEGLTFASQQLALELDGSTLSKSASGVKVADDGITGTQLNTSVAGNGLTGGGGSALTVEADVTETSTTLASAINVSANGVAIMVDDSTLEGAGQGVAGAEALRVKDAGITEAKLAATSVTAAKLGSDVAGDGLTGGNGAAIDINLAADGGLETDTDQVRINVDATNGTTKVNASNELEGLKAQTDSFTLSAGDISNQYVDLTQTAQSATSIRVVPLGGIEQEQGTDYTISLTGGAGGVTRITFAGDIATGGDAALIANDVLIVKYEYL